MPEPPAAAPALPHRTPSLAVLCRAVTFRMVRRSAATAVVVGGLLFGINSGEALLRAGLTSGLVVKGLVTMAIPFLVSLTSAALTRLELRTALGGRDATCAPLGEADQAALSCPSDE